MASRSIVIIAGAAVLGLVTGGGAFVAYRKSEGYDVSVATGKDDSWTRREAMGRLYNRSDPNGVGPIFVKLLDDEDSGMRAEAAQYLGWMHYKPAVAPLLAALPKQTYDREKFFKALGEIGDPSVLAPLLQAFDAAKDKSEARAVASAFAKLGPAVVPALVARLANAKAEIRAASAAALGWYAFDNYTEPQLKQVLAPAIDPLIPLMRDPSTDVRISTADAMGRIRDAKFLPALIDAIGTRDDTEREVLGRVISYYGDDALAALTAPFQSDDLYKRMGAAQALDALNYVGVYDSLRKNESYVRSAAAILDAAATRRDLVAAAGGFDYFIRRGSPTSVSYLIAALKAHGHKAMAEALLNCGNSELEQATKSWAADNGFTVETTTRTRSNTWGKN